MSQVVERRANDTEDTKPADEPDRTFEQVYQLYGQRVLRLAFRFTQNEAHSQDLTQDIFIKVYEHMDEFRNESQVYTWIHRIAINHILNHLRRERRNKWMDIMDQKVSSLLHEESSLSASAGVSPARTPHQEMERSERETIVLSAIESLAPKYRVPFVLLRFEEMSYQQIADSLNLSLSAVEARIHRAKKQLIQKLEPLIEHI